mgnify:CR=1 FL=1
MQTDPPSGQERPQGVLIPVMEFLGRHSPFDQMDPVHLEFLAKRLKLVFYAHDEEVTGPRAGPANRFFIIKQGRVLGEPLDADGNITSTAWELVPGECFPVGALMGRRPVRTRYRAAEDTFCFELDREDFHKLFRMSGEFQDFCTRRLASLLDKVRRQVQASAAAGLGGDTSLNITLGERVRRDPVTCPPGTPIRRVLQTMDDEHVGSVVVVDANHRPLGVFTLHDLLSRVSLPEVGLDEPIEAVMTPDPITLPPTAFAFEAAMLMASHGFHHLCIVERGRLTGVISERDLFSLQRVGLVNLSRAVGRAEDVATLARLGRDVHLLIGQMIAQGVRVDQITQIITLLNDQVTRRVIRLCLDDTDPELPEFTWLAFGSEGRQEQTLKTDQDNGILFLPREGMTDEEARQRLLPLAQRINQALDLCGFPLCKGNVMAGNPECCLSADEWRQRFTRWIDQGTPRHLLNASIYFDFRVLHGNQAAGEDLRTWLLEKTSQNSRFLRQMAENALRLRPPLGLFGDFKVTSGGSHPRSLDLKVNGATPIVDVARIHALAHQVPESNTARRLEACAGAGLMKREDVAAWLNAYHYIQLLRMRSHQDQAQVGQPLSNFINPERLDELEQRILKEAFRQVRKLQSRLALDYQL